MSLDTLKDKVERLIKKAQNSGEDTLTQWFSKTLVSYKNENTEELIANYFFANNPYLVSIDLPNLWRMFDFTFENCENLTSVNIPKATYVGAGSFLNCKNIESLRFPVAITVYRQAFEGASNLKTVDFGDPLNFVGYDAFRGCSKFETLILRGHKVSTLSNINNFDSAGAFASGASGGTVYVPSALIESYKIATNWSALYEAGRCNFVAIEGSEYE